MPRCNPYQKFALEQILDDAAAEKTNPAKYGHLPSCRRSVPSPMPSCHSATSPQADVAEQFRSYTSERKRIARLTRHFQNQPIVAVTTIFVADMHVDGVGADLERGG